MVCMLNFCEYLVNMRPIPQTTYFNKNDPSIYDICEYIAITIPTLTQHPVEDEHLME